MMDWNSRYSESGYAYGVTANDFLKSISDKLHVGACLSLAEGEGRNAVFLAKNHHTVTAVDSSNVGLDKANKLATKHNVSINTVHCDLHTYTIKTQSFDSIISIFCHVPAALHKKSCTYKW